MSEDIKINESAILETLNAKIDYDGGNYKGSGLANYVVDKSGDTITGQFNLRAGLNLNAPNTTKGTNPTSSAYWGIRFNDDTNKSSSKWQDTRLGIIETALDTTGTTKITMGVYKNETGNGSFQGLTISCTSAGYVTCDFPKCTTKATTTSSASSNKVAVVVQNYVNGTSWYRVWSDGWIEQGGYLTMTANVTTLTFLKSFTNTNYTIVGTKGRGNTTNSRVVNLSNLTAKTVDVSIPYANALATDYNVNWYACGY